MTDFKLPLPTRPDLLELHACLSADCWEKRYQEARARVRVVQALLARCGQCKPGRADLRAVVPREDRTNALRWWTRHQEGEGEPWERLFDRRAPERPWQTPEAWRAAVEALGALSPVPSCEQIRTALVRRFGEAARLGDTTIRAILHAAGLATSGPVAPSKEKVVELSGGGGLVLLLAAARETGATEQMAEAVSRLARRQVAPANGGRPEAGGRDEAGHFTAEYNQFRLAQLAEQDLPFFRSVTEARPEKDLTRLRLCRLSPRTLANHLLCLTALPLVTERRGTVGLDGPAGAWLAALDSVPYRAKTLEKTLEELKWLGADDALWSCHAQLWLSVSARWTAGSPDSWRQLALYVDATNDPWWTQRFATCGKVSRTGRVQPSLQRVVVSAGPGVPILGEVISGHRHLGQELTQLLDQVDRSAGPGQVRRITVVDAECCYLELLHGFAGHPARDIVTVLKGALGQGKELLSPGPWQPFRERDQLREGQVVLGTGPGQQKLTLRVVEMARPDSRRPQPTRFVTTAAVETLSTRDVAEAYLHRWPYQEDLFRRGRDGAGLERSGGFGAHAVTHVAVIEKREKAQRRLRAAALASAEARGAEADAVLQQAAAEERVAQRRAQGETLDGRHQLGVRLAEQRLTERRREAQAARRQQEQAQQELARLEATPSEIFVRDTALESVSTCIKLLLLALLEFVCQEYLGGRRITPRLFIESFVQLPVTIRRSRHQVVYEVAPNPRDPETTALLRQALDVVTKRKLRLDGRALVARLREPAARSTSG